MTLVHRHARPPLRYPVARRPEHRRVNPRPVDCPRQGECSTRVRSAVHPWHVQGPRPGEASYTYQCRRGKHPHVQESSHCASNTGAATVTAGEPAITMVLLLSAGRTPRLGQIRRLQLHQASQFAYQVAFMIAETSVG